MITSASATNTARDGYDVALVPMSPTLIAVNAMKTNTAKSAISMLGVRISGLKMNRNGNRKIG